MDTALRTKLQRMIARHDALLNRAARMLSAAQRGQQMPSDAEYHNDELKSLDENASDLVVELNGFLPSRTDWTPPTSFSYQGYGSENNHPFWWLEKFEQGLRLSKRYFESFLDKSQKNEEIQKSTSHIHQHFGEIYMGDLFQGISNSTIVSRSHVEGAFNQLQASGREDEATLLVEIGNRVSDSKNSVAGNVYAQLVNEFSKPNHDKSVIKSCWEGLVAILPPLANLSTAVIKAFAI